MESFFQILHDVNYWLVVARVAECAGGEVYFNDSLTSAYTPKQICQMQICQIKLLKR